MAITPAISPEGLDPRLDMDQAYMGTSANVQMRFNVYRYSEDGVDIHDRIIDNLGLDGYETVADVGCASGSTLAAMRLQHGHFGTLIGIDIDQRLFTATRNLTARHEARPIDFRVDNAMSLDELPDGSVDVLLALFMLYHVPDKHAALSTFQRIIRPGGRVVVATSGPENKTRHRQFEQEIADYLGVKPPPRFAAPFSPSIAQSLLPRYFEVEERPLIQDTGLIIPDDPKAIEDYLLSLQTMKDSFAPSPVASQWREAIEAVVRPQIKAEIETQGYFRDRIQRYAYFLVNTS